ncbi:MAG: hypothetical protein L3J71_10695 [Victivallaceae bacterium]|nr:hypothetical protein [Victivallaceae bacterium]
MQPGFTRSGVIKKVKRAFHRITPSRSRREGSSFLIVMNVPPLMGRRDSACQCMIDLLRTDIFSLSEAERSTLYKNALELIDIILKSTVDISAATRDLKNEREKRLFKYFSLLLELVQAALALVEPAIILQNDEASIQGVLGGSDSTQLRQLEEVLSESEINIIQSLNDFIASSQAQLIIDREISMRSLPRQNQERYSKSFEEFKRRYGTNIVAE